MKQLKLENHLTVNEIRNKLHNSNNKDEYRRWQALLIILTMKINASEIAMILGVAKTTIYKWVQIYNNQGYIGYEFVGSGGRRHSLMSLVEEKELLSSLSEASESGSFVNATKIRKAVEQKIGKKVSKNYVYNLLHRHNWRKIVPRPNHPKKDKEKQTEYKKNSCFLWIKQ